MSPTQTDDALVRELRERTESAVPPMELNPDALLADARRYRRWRAARNSAAGAVGVAVIAFGVVSLADGRDGSGLTTAAQLVGVGDFTVIAATEALPVDPAAEPRPGTLEVRGSLYDTGVPVDPADPNGARWVLEHVVLDPEPGMVNDFLAARVYDPATGEVGESLPGASTVRGDGFREPEVDAMGTEFGDTLIAFGLAGRGYRPEIYVSGARVPDASAVESRVLLPTFIVPGVEGYVYFVQVAGNQPWPHISVYPAANISLQLNWDPDPNPRGLP